MILKRQLILPLKYKSLLKRLFKKHTPNVEVLAYGSRIQGKSHPASDLDLALRSPDLKKIPPKKLNALRSALSESSIPFLVEARDYALLPKSFQLEIEKSHIVVFSEERPLLDSKKE